MPARILIHVQQLVGHGHLRRMSRIADGLAAAGHMVTVASGGLPAPEVAPRLAKLVQLPPAQALDGDYGRLADEAGAPLDGDWEARRWTATNRLAQYLRPDLLIVELFPFGRRAFAFELTPLIQIVAARGGRVAFSLRDILVGGRDAARDADAAHFARDWADLILVHGDPEVCRLEAQVPALAPLADRLRYTGYVTEAQAGATGDRYGVVVTAGSGVHGAPLMRAAMAARLAGALANRPWTFVAGPQAPQGLVAELVEQAPEGVAVWPSHDALPRLIANSGLVIAQGGYNTVMEAVAARCPLIVVPHQAGREDEQTARARLFAGRGLLTLADSAGLTPALIEGAGPPAGAAPDLDGVAGTVAALQPLL